MTFKLACGDVMPGCTSRFENESKDGLMNEVATHAAADHGVTEVTPEIASAIDSKIVTA